MSKLLGLITVLFYNVCLSSVSWFSSHWSTQNSLTMISPSLAHFCTYSLISYLYCCWIFNSSTVISYEKSVFIFLPQHWSSILCQQHWKICIFLTSPLPHTSISYQWAKYTKPIYFSSLLLSKHHYVLLGQLLIVTWLFPLASFIHPPPATRVISVKCKPIISLLA